jgi:hypothetical protein
MLMNPHDGDFRNLHIISLLLSLLAAKHGAEPIGFAETTPALYPHKVADID